MDVVSFDHKEKCTLIETLHGEVKLIKRAHANLMTLNFSNLKECLAYVDKNQFQINIIHSGRRKDDRKPSGGGGDKNKRQEELVNLEKILDLGKRTWVAYTDYKNKWVCAEFPIVNGCPNVGGLGFIKRKRRWKEANDRPE